MISCFYGTGTRLGRTTGLTTGLRCRRQGLNNGKLEGIMSRDFIRNPKLVRQKAEAASHTATESSRRTSRIGSKSLGC